MAGFLLPTGLFLLAAPMPAHAQGLSIIRDTEIERVLYSYEVPLLKAAGIDPDTVKMYLLADPEFNAFATQSPDPSESEDIFVQTGLLLKTKSPNEVIGILAHETGHIAGGDVIRGGDAMSKASIPMLIGMVVGVAAMIAGAGAAGMGAIMLGQSAAEAQYLQFSRAQEATADQRAITFLNRTHQSGEGLLAAFARIANEQAMTADFDKTFISDHPADRQRIDQLQNRVDASPWKNVKDSPAAIHEFHMIQAKLIGYLDNPDSVLLRYPASDTSDEALYARAMAYFRKPDMKMALEQINTLIQRDPSNPYFWEVLGQLYVEMAQPEKGIAPYQKAVDLLPDAPLIRTALAAGRARHREAAIRQARARQPAGGGAVRAQQRFQLVRDGRGLQHAGQPADGGPFHRRALLLGRRHERGRLFRRSGRAETAQGINGMATGQRYRVRCRAPDQAQLSGPQTEVS